ncbi:MAG TPA: M24 family metallopeptidase, partial [Thermoplasmatales archaeon]|nr:M24 family metallopeptidase [Thermoplasmatales archaeon]
MNEEVYRKYKKAGWVAAEALKYGIEQIKEGVSYLEIAETVEKKIKDLGAGLAFPVNIAVNEVAAHFTPRHNDGHIFQKGDVVKLDVGAHVDGYIADTAATTEVENDRYSDLMQASHDALANVIDAVKPNVKLQ